MTKMTKIMISMTIAVIFIGSFLFGISQNAFAVSTITFDSYSDGTIITNQYNTDGVIFSSASYTLKVLNDAGETPGPPSTPNILVSNSGPNNGDIIISVVDHVTFDPTSASSISFKLFSVGNNKVTVVAKDPGNNVIDTQNFQHIDVGGVNCVYVEWPSGCPGPITNGWAQTDSYSFSGNIRTVTITSSQAVDGDGYGIDDVLVTIPTIEKTYTHTNNNWSPVCDGYINPQNNLCYLENTYDTQIRYKPANINTENVFAFPLDQQGDAYVLYGNVIKSKTIVNPGQYIQATSITTPIKQDVMFHEDVASCSPIGTINPNKVPGGIQVVLIDSNGNVFDISSNLAKGIGGTMTLVGTMVDVVVKDVPAGDTIRVMIKFQPSSALGIIGTSCTLTATTLSIPVSATLKIIQK